MSTSIEKLQFIDLILPGLADIQARKKRLLSDAEALEAFRTTIETQTSHSLQDLHFDFTPEEIVHILDLLKEYAYLTPAFITLLSPSIFANSLEHQLPEYLEMPSLDMATTLFGYPNGEKGHPDYLCSYAEDNLSTSMTLQTARIVNTHFIFKTVGLPALYALENVHTKNGFFQANHWYVPVSPHRRSVSFPSTTHCDMNSSVWSYCRPVGDSQNGAPIAMTLKRTHEFVGANQKEFKV